MTRLWLVKYCPYLLVVYAVVGAEVALELQLDPLVLSHSWDIVPFSPNLVLCDFIPLSDLLCLGPS